MANKSYNPILSSFSKLGSSDSQLEKEKKKREKDSTPKVTY